MCNVIASAFQDIEDRVITMVVEAEVGMSNRTVEETIQAAMLISVDATEEIQTGDLHLITISESQPQVSRPTFHDTYLTMLEKNMQFK